MAKRYIVKIDLPDGRKVEVSGSTQKKLIENALAKYGCLMGTPESKDSPTFGSYARKWWKLYKVPKHKPTTLQTYENTFEKHIYPFFQNIPLGEITIDTVQAFFNRHMNLSWSSVRQMKILLHEVFKAAIEDGYMEKDPTASSRLVLPSKKTIREALPTNDFVDVIKQISLLESEDAKLIALMTFTGMRRNEVLGLRWEDIDFDGGVIHIQRGVTYTSNQPIVGTPKSRAGFRDIPITEHLLPYLHPTQANGYVIGDGDAPITQSRYDRAMERISKTINLYGATAHIFRHSYLTFLGTLNTNVKTIQAIAGHSDIQTTMNRYVHRDKEQIQAAGRSFGKKITKLLTNTNASKPALPNGSDA